MRIISGSFKGKKISEPKDIKTRPLKDLTKESIFNIIIHSKKFKMNLENSIILDLFSGVGSFGIECLSRNVKKVIFVENYNGVLPLLKRNLENLNLNEKFSVLENDIYEGNLFSKLENKFDIIFLDPPYKDYNIKKIFDEIQKRSILKKDGIIILHRHKKEKDIIPTNFKIVDVKQYGISKINFIKLLS